MRDAARLDVLVVGAGPAGSVLATLLARRGWRVKLVDRARFPRPKPCGECVNPGAVALLDELGLLERVRALDPAPLRGWRVGTPASEPAVGTFPPSCPGGLGVTRSRFDRALLEAAVEAGADFRPGVRVEEARPGSGTRTPSVRLRDGSGRTETLSARVVVGADGLRSTVARSLDAHRRRPRLRKLSLTVRLRGAGPPRDRGRLVLSDEVVLGLAPVRGGEPLWNATVVARSDALGRRVAADARGFVEEVLARHGPRWREPPGIVGGPWASGPFDWPTRSVVGPGVLLVGDAAGYYDPLTGQGIFRALRSARLAAGALDPSLRRTGASTRVHRDYQRALRRRFGPGRRIQKLVETAVSSRRVREWIVPRLRRAPGSLDMLIGVTGDARPARSLLGPGFWAPLAAPGLVGGADGPGRTAGRGPG